MNDYLIIGAGIFGAAAAYELATHGNVALVDAESRAGYYSAGRSAAMYTPNYGGELIRKICRLRHSFLDGHECLMLMWTSYTQDRNPLLFRERSIQSSKVSKNPFSVLRTE